MGGVLLCKSEAVGALHTSQTGPIEHKVKKGLFEKIQCHLNFIAHTYREMLQFAHENDHVAQEIAER